MVSGAITFTWNKKLWRRSRFLVSWLHFLWISWRKTSFSILIWNRSAIWNFQDFGNSKKKWLAWNFRFGRIQTKLSKIRSESSLFQEIVTWGSKMVVSPSESKPIEKNDSHESIERQVLTKILKKLNDHQLIHLFY